ncbi:hypothetical protein A3Q56_07994, partial [Intoshia linei]
MLQFVSIYLILIFLAHETLESDVTISRHIDSSIIYDKYWLFVYDEETYQYLYGRFMNNFCYYYIKVKYCYERLKTEENIHKYDISEGHPSRWINRLYIVKPINENILRTDYSVFYAQTVNIEIKFKKCLGLLMGTSIRNRDSQQLARSDEDF